ncbi:hypothetical protein CHS0354_025207 [Potamilus streckersoni]|uniref:DUF7042 domain-containing protein n=1 Tax=Potamilus streckersoni TaxID=2493646 RepID=A0AAE0RNL8_9BIVA|nr:hypothetical protein CHS0354_025207 [Potamilus streckersoni]
MAKCGSKMIFCFVFGAIIISSSATNCTFPASMDGTWLSSSHGTWVANETHIYGMNFTINGDKNTGPNGLNFTFSCLENHGDSLYAIASTSKYEIFSGLFRTLHTCIDLRDISFAKFVYYIAKAPFSNGDILTANNSYEGICDSSDYNASYAHHVILRNGSESDAFILCPPSIYGTYSYNESCKEPMYNTTSVNVCTTRKEIVFNYNVCSTPLMYSQEGILDCVYYITNGSISYLTVYNSDSTTPDEVDYYRFTCIVLEEITNVVYLTARAKECQASQNTTFVNNGQTMVWRPYELCPIEVADKQEDLIWIAIVVAVVAALVILIIFIFVIVRCIRRRKQRKIDEEQSITEENSVVERSSEKDERNEERHSIDSGIGEPITTGGNEEKRDNSVNTVGEVYVDDSPLTSARKIESDRSDDHSEDKGEEDQPKGSLTKTLISREDEERKRQRKGKDKKKKLRKLGKKKVKQKIGKSVVEGDGSFEGEYSESGSLDSEEEGSRIDGAVIAPFTKQYKYKKHIEHVLEEEKSMSEEDKGDEENNYYDLNTLSPSAATDILVGAEEDAGPNVIGKETKSGTDDVSEVTLVEDATKMHANADTYDMVKREERHDGVDRKGTRKETVDKDETYTHNFTVKDTTHCSDNVLNANSSKKEITLLHAKEVRQKKRKDKKTTMEVGEASYDSCSTETDSGVGDDDETYIDLQLTKDQQEFIYNSLQDKHGNLKPVFKRNEEGKIVRKSDETVVFDPHTGKVRIRKQIGNIFNIPRLKRNKNGRLIGGYHDAPFGPTKQTDVEAELAALDDDVYNNSISGKPSSSSRRTSNIPSARDPNKENIVRSKTVAFDVRDEMEVLPMDITELCELRRTGRRDITSAIRKKLRDRLFRRRKHIGGPAPNDLPIRVPVNGKTKQAWVHSDSHTVQEKLEVDEANGINGEHVQLKPLVKMHVRHSPLWSSGSPMRASGRHGGIPYHRSVGAVSTDPKYLKMFQQGLEKDTKVLHSLNEQHMLMNRRNMRKELHAAGEKKDLDHDQNNQTRKMTFDSSLLEDEVGYQDAEGRTCTRTGLNSTRRYGDYRLRILLEELFRDKKYFDHLIETTDSKSDVLMMTKDIAEYGRGFLLERAEFWDVREPIPPRPPLTPYGFSMSRAHTSLQDDINSTSTITPDLRPNSLPTNLPGYVGYEERSRLSKSNIQETEYDGKNETESSV